MAAGRHAVHADFAQAEPRCKTRITPDGVNGARHLGRALGPAVRTRAAIVLVVLAAVLRHGDHKASVKEGACQIRMHPRRPARAVGDDEQAAVARSDAAFFGQFQLEAAARHGLSGCAAGIEN